MADTAQDKYKEKQKEVKVKVNGFPFFQILEDGTVRRFLGLDTVPADPHNSAAKSKDVIIDADRGVFVRIFLPRTAHGGGGRGTENLAVIFFVHGGGFCVESAASSTHDPYVRRLAAEARALCVSVEYRLAPETRLPAAYDDSFAALTWLLAGDGRHDTWVAPVAAAGGFGRLVLAGGSAGANIVHDLGLRAAAHGWPSDVRFCGAVMLHPFFHVPRFAAADDDDGDGDVAPFYAAMVSSCLPVGEDVEDYPPFNPAGPRSRPLSESVFQRFLVAVAQEDPVRQAGLEYYRQLVKAGKRAELEQTPAQNHVFFLMDQSCAASLALMKRVVEFVHYDDN